MLLENKEAPVLQQFSLKGKTSLVTGGLRGIGLAAAKGLAEAGSDIAITYNTSGKLLIAELEKQFLDLGVKFKAYQCNVTEKEQIAKCFDQVLADFNRLDIVVPNSGITSQAPAEDFTEEAYRSTMSVNLDGAFFTAQAAANCFKKQRKDGKLDQGRIIFTASVSSLIVNVPQSQAPYNASKAGLVRLAKCLAVEWVDFARVNCVSPGFITTDMLHSLPSEWRESWMQMVPAQRFCSPTELKGVYVFLASDASSYITGDEIVVGGGYTLT